MLNVINLVKKYGNFPAVNNVSFELGNGQAAALLGPNGAGKSTLIKCLLGLLNYTGEIILDGNNIKSNSKVSKARISYIPQEPALYDTRAYDILSFFAKLRKVDPGRIDEVLKQVNLLQHKNKLTSELSGGMKQRLSFAIALLANAKFLILDEPTSNLDSESRNEILRIIKGLKKNGYTILFSSHRVDEVMQIADKVISMNDGKIISVDNINIYREETMDSRVLLILKFENGLINIASRILNNEGFNNLKVENNSISFEINKYEKIIPIQKLLNEEIVVKDFYVEDIDLN
jgi:ABC-type multidrug transport system ATPase subunit